MNSTVNVEEPKNGVPSMIYYPKPLHMQTAYAGLKYAPEDFPASLEASDNVFSLPMHPYLEESVIDEICGYLREACES